MEQKVEPRNRDEREIAGYRYVLDTIHESHDDIPVTPGVILQFHRDLYRYLDSSFAGKWKDSDNAIAERLPTGELVTRFTPTPAAATPAAIQEICDSYEREIEKGVYDPLLVSLVFVFDFVSIHPFNDGNGRMSRLMTLLLLYRNGYTVGKYVSIEAEIEKTKETYYEALAASSVGWNEGLSDYTPFVSYMLGVIGACYSVLDSRFSLLSSSGSNENTIREYFDSLIASASKREILDANPTMSQRTVERILQTLQAEGYVEKIGAARSTRYRRAHELITPAPKQEACSVYTAPGTALGRLLRRPAIGSAPSFRGRTPVGDKPPRPEAAALRLACARLRFSRGIPRAPAAVPPLHAQVLRRRAAVWKGAPSRCTCACPKVSSSRPRRSQASST